MGKIKFNDLPVEDLFRFFDHNNNGFITLEDARRIWLACGFVLDPLEKHLDEETVPEKVTLDILKERLERYFFNLKSHDHNRIMFNLLANKKTQRVSLETLKLFFKEFGDDVEPRVVRHLIEYIQWFDLNEEEFDDNSFGFEAFTGFLNYMTTRR